MATGTDAEGLKGIRAGQFDPARRARQRLLAEAGLSVSGDAGTRCGRVPRTGLIRDMRVAWIWDLADGKFTRGVVFRDPEEAVRRLTATP